MKICLRTDCTMHTFWKNGCIALETVYDDDSACPFFRKQCPAAQKDEKNKKRKRAVPRV